MAVIEGGDNPEPREALRQLMATVHAPKAYTMLRTLFALNMVDEYFALAESSFQGGSPVVEASVWTEQGATVRSDPRFIKVVESYGITKAWDEIGPPPDCRVAGASYTCGHGSVQ